MWPITLRECLPIFFILFSESQQESRVQTGVLARKRSYKQLVKSIRCRNPGPEALFGLLDPNCLGRDKARSIIDDSWRRELVLARDHS